MSSTQDMLRYVASQVRFSGAQLDDRGGSRPLDLSVSTAFQFYYVISSKFAGVPNPKGFPTICSTRMSYVEAPHNVFFLQLVEEKVKLYDIII